MIGGGDEDAKAEDALSTDAVPAVSGEPGTRRPEVILTPDQRVRVFISSTLEELAAERTAARRAIARLRLVPVYYESGARPHPPRNMYRAYLQQSQVFVGIYWQRYGWVAPGMDISGLEDEFRLAAGKPMLVYLKRPAPGLEPRLAAMIDTIREAGTVSYRTFTTVRELERLLADDLAVLLSESFAGAAAGAPMAAAGAGKPAGQELPAGTVTMLFSDIEGSTVLLSRLGGRYAEALSAQRAILRTAISDGRGLEMGTEGDSFFVVFRSAADGVGCCVAAQRALAAYDWPGGVAVRVRMGLHTGEPARYEDGYIGMDVHRAARIAAAAHGGQVVMSQITWQLAQPGLSAELAVRDLGLHRLKDIEKPEHIVQLAGPGLAEQFPPLKSLGAQTSLPVPATPLVGRDRDLGRLRAPLSRPGVRLVTLTGPGGVGKTRLALAAASSLGEDFPDGVFFVSLAAARDAGVMWKAIAGSLDARGDEPGAVTEYLAGRQALLVLDNLEQLDGAAEVVAALLAAAPRLAVLATSRRPLHLQHEHELPVPPLQLPGQVGVQEVASCAAARLFVQQAALVRPDFAVTSGNAADIAAICRRLDGLPLAIELAASRVRLLAPKAILTRLGQSLSLASADLERPSRQQTLRAAIAWSYDLLEPGLAGVFRRVGVFAGDCDLDALAAVAVTGAGAGSDPLELAGGLADVSLVTVTEGDGGEPRVGMLETIREYALERLAEAGEEEEIRRRHAGHYTAFAEQVIQQLNGPEQLATLDRLEAEHDNLLAALSWSLDGGADPAVGERTSVGLRLALALGPFWYQHGHAGEGRRWLQQAIELTAGDAGPSLARSAHWLGMLLLQQNERDSTLRLFERSLAIWRELGDLGEEVRELNSLGGAHRHFGDLDTARSVLEDSVGISRRIGSEAGLSVALLNLAQTETAAGSFGRAAELLQEALALSRKRGDLMRVAIIQQSLAVNSLADGQPAEARDQLSSMLGYVTRSGDTEFIIDALELAAAIAAELSDWRRAARLAGAAEMIRNKAGMPASPSDAAMLERFLAPARAAIAPDEWDAELDAGRGLTYQQAVSLLADPALRDQLS